MNQIPNIIVAILAVVIGGIIVILINSGSENRTRAHLVRRFVISIILLLVFYSALYFFIQSHYDLEIQKTRKVYSEQINSTKNRQQSAVRTQQSTIQKQQSEINALKQQIESQSGEITSLKENNNKILAFAKWQNTIFNSPTAMKKALAQAKVRFNLSAAEVKKWRAAGENNLYKNFLPKNNTQEVLLDYQTRLKRGLSMIKENHLLLSEDLRDLSECFNVVRLVGKEYQKVLVVFRELYDGMINSSSEEPVLPKKAYFLFFPVKQKEYNKHLNEFYESKGNQKGLKETAAKLKKAIETVEEEFSALNKKFDENISFLNSKSNSLSYNSGKLQNLIEAALREIELITEPETDNTVKLLSKPEQ